MFQRHPPEKVRLSRPLRQVTEQELQEHLSSPPALAALSIGLNVERVKRAIRERLEQTGRSYSQPDALVEAALNLQHEEEEYASNEQDSVSESIRDAVSTVLNHMAKQSAETPVQKPISPTVDAWTTDLTRKDLPSIEKSISLEEENRILKEARLCKICMDSDVGIVFLPCGHLATCVNCAPNLEDCPVCRCAIKATVRTFLS